MDGSKDLTERKYSIKVQDLEHCSIHLPQVYSNLFLEHKNLNNLVFELTFVKDSDEKESGEKKVYVSWTGQTSSLPVGSSVVVDRLFLKSLAIEADKYLVKVKPVPKVKVAKSIEVEPVTSDDWEILQLNAGLLEASFLLQCRVVCLNQIIPIRVSNGAHIKIRVLSSEPKDLSCLKLTEKSEIHVKPLERKVDSKQSNLKGRPKFSNLFLRTVLENLISDFQPGLPNDLTIGIHPESLISLQQLESLNLRVTDFPTQVQISAVTRPHLEPTNQESKTNPTNANEGSGKDSLHAKFTVGSTQQIQTLPTKLQVRIIWSTQFPKHHATLSTTLAKSLNTPPFHRIYLDFSHSESPLKPNQIKLVPIFPSATNPEAKSKTKSTGKVNPYNSMPNRPKPTTSKSWIFDLALAWLQSQPKPTHPLILTHGMVIVLPDNHTEKSSSQAVVIDLGLPVVGSEPSVGYCLTTATDLLKARLVESEQPYFTTNLTFHHLVSASSSLDWLKQPLPQLGGIDQLIEKLTHSILAGVAYGEVKASLGLYTSSGILLCGSKGSGKSVILQTIVQKLAKDQRSLTNPIFLNCNALVNERVAVVRDKFQRGIEEAAQTNPALLILDDLDSLIPCEVEHMDSFRSRQLSENLASQVLKARRLFPYLVILATSNQPHSIHQYLLQSHTFTDTFHIPPPDKLSRQKVLQALVNSSPIPTLKQSVPGLDLLQVASATEGYLPSDLKVLVERALHQTAIRQINQLNRTDPKSEGGPKSHLVTAVDFSNAQLGYTPVSLRGVKLQQSSVLWSDVGGLDETRKVLRETLEWPIKYQRIFASCPLRLRSGLLLFGYPGCGKTLLASAVAKECQLNFITVKGPEILNKYIGASEQSVRDLFQRAMAAKPCVLFFDEFEAIAPRRGHDSTGVTDRVVNQLLTQMDGAEGLEGVYVLAATSRPDLIDPALLRPGRLDKALLCGMPSTQERLSILKAHATKFALDKEVQARLPELAAQCSQFTGADLQALLYNAHLEAIHSSLDAPHLTALHPPIEPEGFDPNLTFHAFRGSNLATQPNLNGKGDFHPPPPPTLTKAESDLVQLRLQTIRKQSLARQPKSIGGRPTLHEPSSDKVQVQPTTILWNHILLAKASTQPSLPQLEIDRLKHIYQEFMHGKGDPNKVGKRSTLG